MDITNYLQQVETPCFVLNEQELKTSVNEFSRALQNKFEHSRIGYSVKTNSLPYAIKKAKEYGCFCEVVSDDELALALACGYNLNEIVFNGPMKSKVCFLNAIQGGAIVNIETHRELEWLKDLPAEGVWNVGLRLSVNISDVSPEDEGQENDFSRFGFNDSTSEFADALSAIQSVAQVRLAGLHIHRTSHSRSVRFYRRSVAYAAKVIRKYGLDLNYLDVGGGYFGIFRNAPTFTEYSEAIYQSLAEHGLERLSVIVEPGNALTASAFTYFSTVIDTKELPGIRIITTDGSRNDVDPFFNRKKYLSEILRKDEQRKVIGRQVIAGATCLEYDQLFELENEKELKAGDVIRYNNVGAYTLTLTPMFINYFPRVYSFGNDGLKLVRDKWTANEMIQKSIL